MTNVVTEGNTELQFSPKEEEIKQQLTKFVDGVLNLDSDTQEMPDSEHKDVFTGVSVQLQKMAVNHVEMAWTIAKARGYKSLQIWLKNRYGKVTGGKLNDDGIDDNHEDNPFVRPTKRSAAAVADADNDGPLGASMDTIRPNVAAPTTITTTTTPATTTPDPANSTAGPARRRKRPNKRKV